MAIHQFKECQHFKQSMLWLIIIPGIIPVGILSYSVVIQIFMKQKSDFIQSENSLLLVLFFAVTIIFISIILLFNKAKLTTIITKQEIQFQFYPFHLKPKKISWDSVSHYVIKTYNPIIDYGGWGIKYSLSKKGKAYNVIGNKGLFIILKTGKKIMIGTQKDKELMEFLKQIENDNMLINKVL